jgi:hypothetical protein
LGDQIVLSVTGPKGTYTLIDTDSGDHPGVFWTSRGSPCKPLAVESRMILIVPGYWVRGT